MPRLIVIRGTDEGRQFVLSGDSLPAGRDSSSKVRLTDTEVSRRHAEFVHSPDGYRVRDVGSANGTYVNNQSIKDILLKPGDHVQIGQTILVYSLEQGESAPPSDLADRINLIARESLELSSNILKTIGEAEGNRIMANPDKVEGPWLRNAQALGVLYEATQLISHTSDLNQLLERILDLVFRTLQADRGCILLRSSLPLQDGDAEPASSADFEPMAVRWRDPAKQEKEKLPVSRTIIDYVLREKKGILVSDAEHDARFQTVQSIIRSGIREVICVPMKGRHQSLGVLYLDSSTPVNRLAAAGITGKFAEGHLSLAIAIAHQAALAVEETRYYQAMVNAERLAAVGQTVAALAHDLKNILQNLRSGRDILHMGLDGMDQQLLQQAFRMLDRNHGKVENLVMNMLSYSKEREPAIEKSDLNDIAREVYDLALPRAKERKVELTIKANDPSLRAVPCDPEGIHRALLNIVSNAIDAAEEVEQPKVIIAVGREPILDPSKEAWVYLAVRDNGPGIPAEKLDDVFRPFVSTKGSRGTGLGLAVSRKILREHGGDVAVQSVVGRGTLFKLLLPLRSPLGDAASTSFEMPVAPPEV